MALDTISNYLLAFSAESRPDRRTVIRRIRRGEIVGRRIGGMWYVDADARPPSPSLPELAEMLFERLSVRDRLNG